MTLLDYVVIEQLTLVSWFGLSLWDQTTGSVVSDGIAVRVSASPITERSQWQMAVLNRSGVFVVADLPRPDVTSPPTEYIVEVVDSSDRFVSFIVPVAAPDEWGFVIPSCSVAPAAASPAGRTVPLPLFNTPARNAPAGTAVVRATLTDAMTGTAAAFAVVDVRSDGRTLGRGIADERGEVAVMFAYPEPEPPPAWSPPGAPSRPKPLTEQQWPIEIAVHYRPGISRIRTGAMRRPLVNLCEVLSQPPAVIVAGSPGWAAEDTTLRYGETLVFGGSHGVLVRAS